MTHRRASFHQSTRTFALLASVIGAASCAPTAGPPPQPVVRSPQLVPLPASLVTVAGAPFNIPRTTNISVDTTNAEVRASGDMLGALIRRPTGFPITVTSLAAPSAGAIGLRLAPERGSLGTEGYELNVTSDSVRLTAASPAG